VDHVLTATELQAARDGLHATLQKHGVDPDNLTTTAQHLQSLSSTGGAGGVLDVFYEDWKIALVSCNETLFRLTTELWRAAYSFTAGERDTSIPNDKQDLPVDEQWKWHPYGPFDCNKGYLYLDRIGFRLPTALAEQLGTTNNNNQKQKKALPIQRSLTPHLDCCPETFFAESNPKWRPIQCLVSLSDTLEANHGGLEVAPGFHREFDAWAAHRPPTVITKKNKQQKQQQSRKRHESTNSNNEIEYETTEYPAPCHGQYTHIRPTEDAAILRRVQHVPGVKAGSAVFWDNRLPHSNAYRHVGESPRAVVYASFLPDVPVNRRYAARQLKEWRAGRPPTDQWINRVAANNNNDNDDDNNETTTNNTAINEQAEERMNAVLSTPLARKLAGLNPW